jgi:hypothetical protein
MPPPSLLRSLVDGAVRDLAWTIGSPTLLAPGHPAFSGRVLDDEFHAARLAEASDWLHELDADPEALHAFIEERHAHRLGHYFENLIEFWLRRAGVADLRARLPVGETGHALGEFDFVFSSDDWGGWQHWEAAVKFYLLHAPAPARPVPEWEDFIGPNPRDRLANKLHKLFDKQLMLGAAPAGRAVLAAAASPMPRAFVKGYLFFPLGSERPSVPGLSPHGLSGWWLRHGAAPLPARHPHTRWKLLHRLAWLAPARTTADDKLAFDTAHMNTVLARHFARSQTPVLLAELAADEHGAWDEVSRGFVVSPSWPAL